jgi:hypothetical protein
MAKSLSLTSCSTGVGSRIPSVEDRLLHGDQQVARAQLQLHGILRDLLIETADDHDIRDDVGPAELATYCLRALTAVGSLPTKAAVSSMSPSPGNVPDNREPGDAYADDRRVNSRPTRPSRGGTSQHITVLDADTAEAWLTPERHLGC